MIRITAIIVASLCLTMTACNKRANEIEWMTVPSGEYVLGSKEEGATFGPARCKLAQFDISANEIGAGLFCRHLNDHPESAITNHPQIILSGNRYVPLETASDKPLCYVSYNDALRFCEWLSGKYKCVVRLPTRQEWEAAARGGVAGARYPWGWGTPQGRANFASDGVVRAGSYPANGYGLYDMAGNLFEWCRADGPEAAPIRGGSWSEKDPGTLRVFYEDCIDPNYRGADVGFRIVRESPKGEY